MSGKRALVSLTFDDALDVHLDAAIPVLDAAGIAGTFYVNVGAPSFTGRHEEWKQAALRGHELGNHTIFHPGVSSKDWVTPGIALETYTPDRMRKELEAANRLLGMIDGKAQRSFAFPCSNPWLGRNGWPRRALAGLGLDRTRIAGWVDKFGLDFGATLLDYTPIVQEVFPAARCGGLATEDIASRPPNRHRVRAVPGDGSSSAFLDAALDTAAERDAWLVLVFHGIGGGHHLSCDLEVFQGLVSRLASDPRFESVTFLEGARRTWQESQAA
jgi:sialate O-acetylesterase